MRGSFQFKEKSAINMQDEVFKWQKNLQSECIKRKFLQALEHLIAHFCRLQFFHSSAC